MKETDESDIFLSSSWFRFRNVGENDKMLRLLEQKDDRTPLTKMALTPCTLSLCGGGSCGIASMPRFGKQTQFAGTNCAKQTQFRQREKKRQVLGGKRVMVYCTCTKPRPNKAN